MLSNSELHQPKKIPQSLISQKRSSACEQLIALLGHLLSVKTVTGPDEIYKRGSPLVWLIIVEHGKNVDCLTLGSLS